MLIKSLKFEALSFAHEGQDPVFKNVDFEFPVGTTSVIRGEHGAGRSTLVSILAGMNLPTQGKYLLNGLDVGDMSFEDFLPFRLKIGYGFDIGGLISNRTIFDNLMLPLQYHKFLEYEEARARVSNYLKQFGLTKFSDLRPAHVSGWVRKITCLIRSIIHEPELLFLDDPSIGLTNDGQEIFIQVLKDKVKAGSLHTLIISSYDETFIGRFDSKNIYIESGLIFADEDVKKVAHL
jgi:ABC-type transporter Mla maintaining outer membrane lipid asymmetry ATPase subunit MlaF